VISAANVRLRVGGAAAAPGLVRLGAGKTLTGLLDGQQVSTAIAASMAGGSAAR
jgi:hypothetical protein